MSIYPELDGLTLSELQERFWGAPIDGPNYALSYFEEVAFAIRTHGEAGLAFLRTAVTSATRPRLPAILVALTTAPVRSPELIPTLLTYLSGRDAVLTTVAVDGLAGQGVTAALPQVIRLLNHRSPYVRASALRYLRDLFPEKAPVYLQAALADKHYIVRECAVDVFDDLGLGDLLPDPRPLIDILPAIRLLLDDAHPHVRQAAATFIEHWASG